jgi:hypothetical protein
MDRFDSVCRLTAVGGENVLKCAATARRDILAVHLEKERRAAMTDTSVAFQNFSIARDRSKHHRKVQKCAHILFSAVGFGERTEQSRPSSSLAAVL